MDILFLILEILGGLAAIVVLIKAIVALNRWWSRGRRPPPTLATEETLSAIDTKLGQIAEYLNGLPKAPPKIRRPFIEAQELEKDNKYREAIKQYEACFQPETTDSQRAALHILIGNCFLSLSEIEEAEEHYKEAEIIAREANNDEGLAAALSNRGIIYGIKGELDKAIYYCHQSLDIEREIGNREGEASVLGNIGIIYRYKGDNEKALEYYEQALNIAREKQLSKIEASQLGNIGIIYHLKGELDKALNYYHKAINIANEKQYNVIEANQLGNIGVIYGKKGELNKALEYLQHALNMFKEIGVTIETEKTERYIQDIMYRM